MRAGTPGVDVERDELRNARLELERMAGLAAGRRAGVQHAHAGRCSEEARRELRGCILHRGVAFRKAGQRIDVRGCGEPDRLGREFASLRPLSCRLEPREVTIARNTACIDPQPHGWLAVARRGDGFRAVAPVALNGIEHPFRMCQPRGAHAVRAADDRLAFTLEPPQDRVDEPRRARPAERARRLDGLGHRRMLRRCAMEELEEADEHQRTNVRVELHVRAVEKTCQAGVELEIPAHGAEGD